MEAVYLYVVVTKQKKEKKTEQLKTSGLHFSQVLKSLNSLPYGKNKKKQKKCECRIKLLAPRKRIGAGLYILKTVV